MVKKLAKKMEQIKFGEKLAKKGATKI